MNPPKTAAGAVSSPHKDPPGACFKNTHVTIEVGPKKKVYIIHKDLLTFYSDYFRGAFNGSFKEATEGKISLHDEHEFVFDIFNRFIYTRAIADEKEHELAWDALVDIWLFGDRYIVPSLQNAVMDALVKKSNLKGQIPTCQISNIWEKTLPSSPLREFILDRVVYRLDVSSIRAHEWRWTREALLDLVEAYANKAGSKSSKSPERGSCYHHIHKGKEGCYS